MSHCETDAALVIEALHIGLRPLLCLVIPRLAERRLLVTVSQLQSDRYLSRSIELTALRHPDRRAAWIAEIKACFAAAQFQR